MKRKAARTPQLPLRAVTTLEAWTMVERRGPSRIRGMRKEARPVDQPLGGVGCLLRAGLMAGYEPKVLRLMLVRGEKIRCLAIIPPPPLRRTRNRCVVNALSQYKLLPRVAGSAPHGIREVQIKGDSIEDLPITWKRRDIQRQSLVLILG